jgi:DNA-binding CsgD family transcriptional regulator
MRAYELIDTTLSTHRRSAAEQAALVVGVDPTATEDVMGRLAGRAQRSIGVMLPDNDEQARAVCSAVEKLGEARRRKLAIRVLCTPRALSGGMVRGGMVRGGPASEVRVAEGAVRGVMIVDGKAALVRADGRSAYRSTSVVHDPAVVRVIESLFAGAWSTAVLAEEYLRLGGRSRTDMARRILRYLSAGHTDDAAARDMGVSLRTYRRHVAEIMRALGVNSRFQAGARAVELGLVPGDDESGTPVM